MMRQSIALVTALHAIGFAFVAMAAVRWPSLIAVGALFAEGTSPMAELQGLVDWREIGLNYGAPYFMAAICFYAASTLVQRQARGAILFFVLGVACGFPPFLLFEFEPGWWNSPNLFEQCVLASAILNFVILAVLWDLSNRHESVESGGAVTEDDPLVLAHRVAQPAVEAVSPTVAVERKPVRRRPVPPAIARQRASFAAHGRRALARRAR